jgi:flagellar biosynthesis protein FliR
MVSISSELINSWIISLLWPLTRVLGVIASAPVLSDRSIPMRIKLGFGLVLTLIIIPTLPEIPLFEIFSLQGLLILVQQLIIGLAMGFSVRLVFAAVGIAGQLIAMTMGLGFATFFDPQTQGQNTAISQFLTILLMLIFLSLDGHLMMISALVNSFVSMPIGLETDSISPIKVAMWGEVIFTTGVLLALPAVTALLVTNMALGILTRTAPQLNLFGIGFPLTLSIGFLVLALALQGMLMPMKSMVADGLTYMQQIVTPELNVKEPENR